MRRRGLEQLVNWYILSGRPDDGRRLLNEILTEFPDSGVANYWLGVLTLRGEGDGAARQALAYLERSLAGDPAENGEYRNAQFQSGVCLVRLGRFDEAERAFRTLLDAEPGNSSAQYELVQVLQRLGKADEARQLLGPFQEQEALARRRKHLESQVGLKQATAANLLELAGIYVDVKEAARARDVAAMYLQREPIDPRGHRLLARAYELLQQPEAAAAEEKLAAALPEVTEAGAAGQSTTEEAEISEAADEP